MYTWYEFVMQLQTSFSSLVGTLWSLCFHHLHGTPHPVLHLHLPASAWDKRKNLWRHRSGIFCQCRETLPVPGAWGGGCRSAREQRSSTHVPHRKGSHGGSPCREAMSVLTEKKEELGYYTDNMFQAHRYCKELHLITYNWWKCSGVFLEKANSVY